MNRLISLLSTESDTGCVCKMGGGGDLS